MGKFVSLHLADLSLIEWGGLPVFFFFCLTGQFLYIPVPQQPGVVCQVKVNLQHLCLKETVAETGKMRSQEHPGNGFAESVAAETSWDPQHEGPSCDRADKDDLGILNQ